MFISNAWAQAAGAGGGGMNGLLSNIAPLILIFVVFYFLLIRPQQRARNTGRCWPACAAATRWSPAAASSARSQVLNDNEIEIELAEGMRVRALKGTLQNIVSRGEPAAKDAANKEAAERPAGLLGGCSAPQEVAGHDPDAEHPALAGLVDLRHHAVLRGARPAQSAARVVLNHLPNWYAGNQINLGLDLRGGVHLLLDVDVRTVLRQNAINLADGIRPRLREKGIQTRDVTADGTTVNVTIRDQAQAEEALSVLRGIDSALTVERTGPTSFRLSYSEQEQVRRRRQILEQSIEVLRRRIDESGTKEPSLQIQGDDGIVIQVPGDTDPAEPNASSARPRDVLPPRRYRLGAGFAALGAGCPAACRPRRAGTRR